MHHQKGVDVKLIESTTFYFVLIECTIWCFQLIAYCQPLLQKVRREHWWVIPLKELLFITSWVMRFSTRPSLCLASSKTHSNRSWRNMTHGRSSTSSVSIWYISLCRMATSTRVFTIFWSWSVEDAQFKCFIVNCLKCLLFIVRITEKDCMIQMFMSFRVLWQRNIIESPPFTKIVTPMTYFNPLSDIMCL